MVELDKGLVGAALGLREVERSESSCNRPNCNPGHSLDRREHSLAAVLEAGNGNCSAYFHRNSDDKDNCSRSLRAREDNCDLSMNCCDKHSVVGCSAAKSKKGLDRLQLDGMRMYRLADLSVFVGLVECYLAL